MLCRFLSFAAWICCVCLCFESRADTQCGAWVRFVHTDSYLARKVFFGDHKENTRNILAELPYGAVSEYFLMSPGYQEIRAYDSLGALVAAAQLVFDPSVLYTVILRADVHQKDLLVIRDTSDRMVHNLQYNRHFMGTYYNLSDAMLSLVIEKKRDNRVVTRLHAIKPYTAASYTPVVGGRYDLEFTILNQEALLMDLPMKRSSRIVGHRYTLVDIFTFRKETQYAFEILTTRHRIGYDKRGCMVLHSDTSN